MKLALLIVVLIGAARADILRLRDGRMFTGNFLGATRTEIWFQHDTPGDFIGTAAYPVDQVESLTFGPAMRQSNAGAHVDSLEKGSFNRSLRSRLARLIAYPASDVLRYQ
ncbi:MAG: hypothetical protein LAO79_17460 [Acidobacteriia bacterium]|nr:hypothetical protein [Terriglobia bacterium]